MRECGIAGHCWHVEDGQSYQRHSGQRVGTTPGTCCRCGEQRELRTGATATAPGVSQAKVAHGKHATARPLVAMVLAKCEACDALNAGLLPGTVGATRCEAHGDAREVVRT